VHDNVQGTRRGAMMEHVGCGRCAPWFLFLLLLLVKEKVDIVATMLHFSSLVFLIFQK
jgi:hypothetical protein